MPHTASKHFSDVSSLVFPQTFSVPSATSATLFADNFPKTRLEKADPGYNDRSPAPYNDDPPPAYEKIPVDVTFDIIEKTLNSEVGRDALHAEIETLGDSVASVEQCFKNVAGGFEKTLEVAMTDFQKADMQGFKKTWDGHYKTYVKLLWQSRCVAGHARVIAIDFAGDFLSVIKEVKYSVAEKKKEIEIYRKELEHDKRNSQDLSRGFLDLRSAVVAFQVDFRQYAARVDKLGNEVEELIKEIQKVGVQLTELTKATLLSAAATLGLAAAAAGTLAIGVICPLLWEGAVFGLCETCKNGIDCLNKFSHRRAVSKDLHKKKLILADRQRSLEGLEKIPIILATLDSDMDFVQEKLGIFAQIWSFIHTDLNEIEKLLDRSSQMELQGYVTKKIQTLSTVYKTLARALSLYETTVHIQEVYTLA